MHVVMAVLCVLVVLGLNVFISSSPSLRDRVKGLKNEAAPVTGIACRAWLFEFASECKQTDHSSLIKSRPFKPCGWSC